MSTSQRKLLMACLILTFFVLVALAMFSTIFALQQVTVVSDLSLAYSAPKEVSASVSASGKTKNADGTDEVDMDTVNFNITEGVADAGTFSLGSAKIENLDDPTVYIYVTITNKEATGAMIYVKTSIVPSASDSDTTTNSNFENMITSNMVSFEDETNYEVYTEDFVGIQLNQTAYLCLKFTVDDLAYDANFSGTINLDFYTSSSWDSAQDPTSSEETATASDTETTETTVEKTIYNSTIAGVGHYPQKYVGNTLNTTLTDLLSSASATDTTSTSSLTAIENSGYTTYVNGTETTLTEYTYTDENSKTYKVACLDSSSVTNTSFKFSTGDSASSNKQYFFYVQPIKVNAMKEYGENSSKTVFITKDVLFNSAFDSASNEWKESSLKGFLNNEEKFLGEIFKTQSETDETTETSKTNGITAIALDDSTTYSLWLPSKDELNDMYTEESQLKKSLTDLTIATGSCYDASNSGYYYTRTKGDTDTTAIYVVSASGGISESAVSDTYSVSFCFVM